jgi:hypothetical protein
VAVLGLLEEHRRLDGLTPSGRLISHRFRPERPDAASAAS